MRQQSHIVAACVVTGALVLSGLSPTTHVVIGQDATVQTLGEGTVLIRPCAAGDRHTYHLDLSAGEFAFVTIDQRGIDVIGRVIAPDARVVVETDSLNVNSGPERVAFVAASSGTYRIEVANTQQPGSAPSGSYELRVRARRFATGDDIDHARAEKLFADAEPLRAQNTAASRAAAISNYAAAADLFKALGHPYEEGLSLYSLGVTRLRGGNTREAVPVLIRARDLFESAREPMYASVVNALGGAYDILGDPDAAMAHYREALAAFVAVGDRAREAVVRNNIGTLHADRSDWSRALDEYRSSLPMFREAGDRRREALALHNIGVSYSSVNELDRAVEYLTQSLAIRREIRDRAGEAETLTQLGASALLRGDATAALARYAEALPLRDLVGDNRQLAATLMFMGRAYLATGDLARALEVQQRAVELCRRAGDRRTEGFALASMAEAHVARGEAALALAAATDALAIFSSTDDTHGLGLALPQMARAKRDLGRLDDALIDAEASLVALENVRGGVSSPEVRAAYLGRHLDAYTLTIDLLARLHATRPGSGYDARALQTSERARARSLLDMLTGSGAELRGGVSPLLLARERELARSLDAKADRLIVAQSGRVAAEVAALEREVRAIEAEYEEVRATIRASSPAYAALTDPQPLTAAEIQRDLLGADTALIEYSLGDDASYAWVVRQDRLSSVRLAPRGEIEQAAREAYALVIARGAAIPSETTRARAQRIAQADAALPAALRRVSDLVLAPLGSLGGVARLAVVADGALQYLPFQMLPLPAAGRRARPLIADFEVVTLPSASTLAVQRAQTRGRPRPSGGVAVFADPVFDGADARLQTSARTVAALPVDAPRLLVHASDDVTGVAARIPRLPFTRDEANAILSAAAGQKNYSAIGFDADKTAATSEMLSQYRYVHFATHGVLDAERPSLSALVMSLVDPDGKPREGFLRAHEIYNMNLPADLVVLSACQTGLGKEINGEGLVGLTRGLMYAGASRVVVSLWSVSDKATSELMGRMYRAMLREGRTPSAALRAAQLALLADTRWQQPYYWAAFILQGDWN